jgi:hypothetical protein
MGQRKAQRPFERVALPHGGPEMAPPQPAEDAQRLKREDGAYNSIRISLYFLRLQPGMHAEN